MATRSCQRCTRPLTEDGTCRSCAPTLVGLVASAAPWADEPAWPRARRWLDDVTPRRDRRPLRVAVVCVVLAALLVVLALT